jgi:hypothetical protein
VYDKDLHIFGRAALLRRPRIQSRAAALPCQEGEDFCHAPRAASGLMAFPRAQKHGNLRRKKNNNGRAHFPESNQLYPVKEI